jgi:hypothetical protein
MLKLPMHLIVIVLLIINLSNGSHIGLHSGFPHDEMIIVLILEFVSIVASCCAHNTHKEEHYEAIPVRVYHIDTFHGRASAPGPNNV